MTVFPESTEGSGLTHGLNHAVTLREQRTVYGRSDQPSWQKRANMEYILRTTSICGAGQRAYALRRDSDSRIANPQGTYIGITVWNMVLGTDTIVGECESPSAHLAEDDKAYEGRSREGV
ncbi:hypothetical protein IEO21_09987 [Rhodonia placenta]|uniref:Uncharacterized protein n=1 Tax=Rhodonia placenta TaxID=104341 RepID=A0A8H7NTC6_9APHY|nr:hypothetical protein IEO21_09987 [Postia placenta]